jgi:hypothetical protein
MQYAPPRLIAPQPIPPRAHPTAIPPPPDLRQTISWRFTASVGGQALKVAFGTLRLRSKTETQCYLTLSELPDFDLSEQLGAEIIVMALEILEDQAQRSRELLRFFLTGVSLAETTHSASASLTGTRIVEYGNLATVALTTIMTQSSTNTSQRWRLPFRLDLKPGDTATFAGGTLLITEIALYLNPSNSYLEITNG